MTETEAKTKWCPFANVYIPYGNTGAGGNRALGDSSTVQGWRGHALCLGSKCMAWRTLDDPDRWHATKAYNKGEYSHTLNEPFGYCGQAGKP